ncbi:MAG: transposase [Polaromonas sp.]|nr:transposase [Polaromonas sp.]
MARLPRLTLPGYAHHVLQRGNNRQLIFSSVEDQQRLLALLDENSRKFGVAIHAYVLMGNHFHLLATPQTDRSLPQMMQAVGRSYVRYFNDRQARSGTLWEGRYRSALVEADAYLLSCMAYLDLNPVRAGVVPDAASYAWSSHGHYVGLRTDRLITPHPLWWSLGNTPFAREAAYADRVRQGLARAAEEALTASVLGGWALGSPGFMAELKRQSGRRAHRATPGRPRVTRLLP